MSAVLTSPLPAAAPASRPARRRVLPGFHLTLGFTLLYLGLVVLIPLAALVWKTLGMDGAAFWAAVSSPRVVAAYRLSFGASLLAAAVNAVFGLLVAWVLVRYEFPGRKIVDAMVDLPFALPTAVAGIALTALLSGGGWLGQYLEPLGIKLAFKPAGVVIALVFIGLPFVVRTVQPVLAEVQKDVEEAALTLGATPLQIFARVIFPAVLPALITGFAMAFARGVGEYGSVIFIAGNVPLVSEIAPLVIVGKLEQYDYAGATAVATVLLVASLAMLLAINGLQAWRDSSRGAA